MGGVLYSDNIASRRVMSFGAALDACEEQIGLDALTEAAPERERIYTEAVRIMADAYTHDPHRCLPIDGEMVTWLNVQEVFEHLTDEHLQHVVDQLEAYAGKIRHPKAFLRAALYNSVFELEIAATNDYATRYAAE